MITNIFKRLTIRATIACFFLSLLANIFNLFCRAGGSFYEEIFIEAFILSLNIILFIVIISFSEARRFNLRFGSPHLLSFPLCIILFNQGQFLNPQKLIIAFSLLFAANILSKDINKINPVKDVFSLGFVLAAVSFLNFNLSLFFCSAGLIILYITKKKESLISLLIGVLSALSILITINHAFTGEYFYVQPEIFGAKIIQPYIKKSSEIIWGTTVLIAFIASVLMKQIRFKKRRRIDLGNGENFMLIWLLISIIFRIFGLYQDGSLWLLSYIPTAFFIGNIFEIIRKDRNREILFFTLLFIGVISKLYENEIILI